MRSAVLLAAIAAATLSGAAIADGVRPAAPASVGPAPWERAVGSEAFAPEDAYLFADIPEAVRLDDEAAFAAGLIDRERLAGDPAQEGQVATSGRVAAAFLDFAAYGPDGEAYATAALVRSNARVVSAATPSLAAFALASR